MIEIFILSKIMKKKHIVILSGAGMSAESGISTFRDSDGLWENHRIEDVASPAGWQRNMALVLDFYNQRRRNLLEVLPNEGHHGLKELEKSYQVTIITQNVDDLHERAGSTKVLHLHGELLKARSTVDEKLVYEWKKDIGIGDKCEKNSQLRPHIVWFGEMVPLLEPAARIVAGADIVVIIGTSLQVYPAAGLIEYALPGIPVYYIDPKPKSSYELGHIRNLQVIAEKATEGVKKLCTDILMY